MGGGVFVCHASEDSATANRVVGALEGAGIRCWIAPRDIAPGENYTQAIIDALGQAPAVVLIFSAATNASPHVSRELETAVGGGTPIVPVRLDGSEPATALRYFIGTSQWLDAVDRSPSIWEPPLVAAVRRAAATDGAAGSVPAAVHPPVSPARRRRIGPVGWAVLAAVALAAVVVIGFLVRGDDGGSAARNPKKPPAKAPTSVVVLDQDFATGAGAFVLGPNHEQTGGLMTRDLVGSTYRLAVTGGPADWDSWTYVDLASIPGDWTISASSTPEGAADMCGVMAGDGLTSYTATVDGFGTTARLARQVKGRTPEEHRFKVSPSVSGPVSLTRAGSTLVMRVGSRTVWSGPVVDLKGPTQAGVAINGNGGCDYDRVTVTHPA